MNALDLQTLESGLGALTPRAGAALAEAGSVCFERGGHVPGALMNVDGSFQEKPKCYWIICDDNARLTWNDPEEATEYGATACALVLIHGLAHFDVVERSRKGTGFDYWLGEEDEYPFQKKARLEVSGIADGSDAQLQQRVNQKLRQTRQSDETSLPVFVAVLEFKTPRAIIATR